MNTYTATVKLNSGMQKVTIQADSAQKAKEMLERQYGSGTVPTLPMRVD
ncbi:MULTISPECIES: hypothetical protein [unclassified Tardiphaga]|jgi:hypothetical protein|nr:MULTISPECIES: hypothetical protein [unclassified Tardiphaga]